MTSSRRRRPGKVWFVTGQVDQTGDTIGSLTFDFLGQTNDAELNTFELEDASGTSLVSMRAADLLEVDGAAALRAPVVQGPDIGRTPRSR